MPYAFTITRQSVYNTSSPGTIVSIVSNVVTVISALVNLAVGRIVYLFNSSTGANIGHWTVVNVASTTVFTVAETLVDQGASGSVAMRFEGLEKIVGTAITSFPDTETIQVVGANFQTNDTATGDRITVYGDANNDGSYLVKEVVDQSNVTVVDRYLAANPLTAGAATGNILLGAGYAELRIIDVSVPDWGLVEAAYPFLVDTTRCLGLTMRRIRTIHEVALEHTGATGTTWTMEDEIVAPYRSDVQNIIFRRWDTGGSALDSVIISGRAGSDEFGFSLGAYQFGSADLISSDEVTSAPDVLRHEMYGSVSYGQLNPGASGKLIGCLAHNFGFILGGTVELRQVNMWTPDSPLGVLSTGVVLENIFIGDTTTANFLAFINPVISNFLLADDVRRPVWRLFGVPNCICRDPKEDYVLPELFEYADGTSNGSVEYSWSPRFVFVDASGLTPVPIQGLTVHVYDFYEGIGLESEHLGSPWVTDVNGQINSGNPIYLQARLGITFGGRLLLERANRLTIEGPNYQFVNYIFKMSAPFFGDVPVELLSIDFEGEMPI